ncbi:5'-deoxynucleotidase [Alteromonas sediminis]|uniref:5'-deoxynucleotidase n=1 Tax=Alteromonas sediminis TaxID=2259342 RepID=A0A3N5Y154_9ALTE|nr:5'-deoxynucleotidase [Alteromonas sediminis]RPJ67517.1 5'-deoxynucleotidase [Alteromonas sediminis]
MKQSTFLAWIMRMPLIKRWALMHTVKRENIAEHSHQVAVIAHLLTVIKRDMFGGSLSPEKAATVAIYHEISESKLQDINHVTKYHNPELTREFKKLEKISEQECLASLPAALQGAFSDLIVQDDVAPEYKRIVKAADIISAYLKACDEIRFGNTEFTKVKERLTLMLAEFERDMPEVNYFMNVFADNCLVSVDELSEQDI